MPILSIRHVTTYHYHQPVAFGEHRMMLRPRDDDDQKVLESELEITPTPRQSPGRRIAFGNHVATRQFRRAGRRAALRQHHSSRPRAGRLSRRRHRGFCPHLSVRLCGGGLARRSSASPSRCPPHAELDRWSAAFFRDDGSADTHDLLVDMTQTIRRTFKHVARHEKGIQDRSDARSRQRELPRPRGADDRGAALARHRRAVCVRISASGRR